MNYLALYKAYFIPNRNLKPYWFLDNNSLFSKNLIHFAFINFSKISYRGNRPIIIKNISIFNISLNNTAKLSLS